MSRPDLRILDVTAGDSSALGEVWRIVYNRGEPIEHRQPLLRSYERGYVADREGLVVGCYAVRSLDLTRGRASLPCGGIAGVAVLPEHRQAGAGYDMMVHSLHEMRRQGHVLASLYAFRDSYYRKFGYEIAGRRWQIRCPQDRLPAIRQSLPGRLIRQEEVSCLDAAYRPFARAMNGAHLRSELDWRDRLGMKAPLIWAVGDPVEGYAWTHLEGGFWDELRVGEVGWSTLEGYRSILAVLAGLCINRSALIWNEPSRSPFLAAYADQGVSFTLDRQAMFRCLDVPAALARLAPECSGEFSLCVEDPFMPDNAGPWRVRFRPDGVEVEQGGEGDIRMDIQAFSQALMGEPSFADLLAMGHVRANGDTGARSACDLLTAAPVTLTEFF